MFKDALLTAADACIPKVIFRKSKRKCCLSEGTIKLVRKKKSIQGAQAVGETRRFPTIQSDQQHGQGLTRDDHRLHLEHMTLNIHTNQKPFWRWLKTQRMGIPSIPALTINGQILTNLKDKANALNNYFVSVFTPGEYPNSVKNSQHQETLNSLIK